MTEAPPAGVDLRPLTRVDPHDVHAVDVTATRDMPALEPPEDLPYEEWSEHVLGHPLYAPGGSFLAYVDGEPAALSLLTADLDSGRAMSWFTGTMPAFRGRGLARAAKLASIRWAAESGVTSMLTMNDETNAPMLAINRKLGYRPLVRRVEYVREAGTASSPAPPAPAR